MLKSMSRNDQARDPARVQGRTRARAQTLSRLPLLLAALLLAPAAWAARPVNNTPCPPMMPITQTPVNTPQGWTLMADPRRDASHHLQAVTFFSGDPQDMASLSPDIEKRTPKGYSSTWRFQQHGGQQDDYWIGCSYTDTNLIAIRKLASNISQCDMTQYLSDRKRPGGSVDIICY